jgi:hypothetical protein
MRAVCKDDEVEEQLEDEHDKNSLISDETAGVVALIAVSESPSLLPLLPN